MKKNQMFKILALLMVVGSLFFGAQSCEKDDDPVDDRDTIQTIEFVVKDRQTKTALSGVEVNAAYSGGASETFSVNNGILVVNVEDIADGELTFDFTKAGFISTQSIVILDRSGINANDDWNFSTTVLLTEANEPVAITAGVETAMQVAGSSASVVFPANSLTENASITITELPSAEDLVEENEAPKIKEGRVALATFNFLPDGQQFEEPIQFTMNLPETTGDYLFGTLVNGAWVTVPVVKNGDGTGTAEINHFSDWSLLNTATWTETTEKRSKEFVEPCGQGITATLNVTPSAANFPTLNVSNTYAPIENSYRVITATYNLVTRTSSEEEVITWGTGPVEWKKSGLTACNPGDHSGGSGS